MDDDQDDAADCWSWWLRANGYSPKKEQGK